MWENGVTTLQGHNPRRKPKQNQLQAKDPPILGESLGYVRACLISTAGVVNSVHPGDPAARGDASEAQRQSEPKRRGADRKFALRRLGSRRRETESGSGSWMASSHASGRLGSNFSRFWFGNCSPNLQMFKKDCRICWVKVDGAVPPFVNREGIARAFGPFCPWG